MLPLSKQFTRQASWISEGPPFGHGGARRPGVRGIRLLFDSVYPLRWRWPETGGPTASFGSSGGAGLPCMWRKSGITPGTLWYVYWLQ